MNSSTKSVEDSKQELDSGPVKYNSHFDDLMADTLHTVDQMIYELRSLRDRASKISQRIEIERDEIRQILDERQILASLNLDPSDAEPETASEITSQDLEIEQSDLFQHLRKAQVFERSLADFASVVISAHRQIETGDDLPDPGSANYLALKMAELRTREEERQRFARDVHDGPAQAFANAIIGLEFIERALKTKSDSVVEDSIAEIERIKRTMREGLTEIRRFIFDNRPTMLRDRGLGPTVLHYVRSYQSIFPMIVRINIDEKVGRLDPDLELAAFRVVQEGIQNASKHARANNVNVALLLADDSTVVVTVTDDGRGFDPERVNSHAMGGMGLKGMSERISLIGGTLDIDSKRGVGTTITLSLPYGTSDIRTGHGQ